MTIPTFTPEDIGRVGRDAHGTRFVVVAIDFEGNERSSARVPAGQRDPIDVVLLLDDFQVPGSDCFRRGTLMHRSYLQGPVMFATSWEWKDA